MMASSTFLRFPSFILFLAAFWSAWLLVYSFASCWEKVATHHLACCKEGALVPKSASQCFHLLAMMVEELRHLPVFLAQGLQRLHRIPSKTDELLLSHTLPSLFLKPILPLQLSLFGNRDCIKTMPVFYTASVALLELIPVVVEAISPTVLKNTECTFLSISYTILF